MKHSSFKRRLEAFQDSKTVILSMLHQVGIYSYSERELSIIIKRCAEELLSGNPSPVKKISKAIRVKK